MRDSNKVITVPKMVNQDVNVKKEGVTSIVEDKINRSVRVGVMYYDNLDAAVGTEDFKIYGDDYDLLMSESPDFASGKPANEYREVDLWYIIDIIRARG